MRWLLRLAAALGFVAAAGAQAGTLAREDVQARVAAPLVVGERYPALPVWPIFRPGPGGPELVAQAFETADIEPVAGYGGKPLNLLVIVDRDGRFADVKLLSHAEPIFMSPRGDATLGAFAAQYRELHTSDAIQIGSPRAERTVREGAALLHGITAGTVTAHAIDKSIMEAAAQVALARLEAAATVTAPRPVPRGPDDRYERTGWNALVNARLVQRLSATHREIEAQFKDTPSARRDAEGILRPEGVALDAWFALLSLPQAGRNLLEPAAWRDVRTRREAGSAVLLVLDDSRYPLGGDPAGRHARLRLEQGGREFALAPMPLDDALRLRGQRSGVGADAVAHGLATAPGSGLDLAAPMVLRVEVSRGGADVARFEHRFEIPEVQRWQPVTETPAWWRIWTQRRVDLAILGVGLAVLAIALLRQRRLAASSQRLRAFRLAYLVFTLGFIGWWAQGQLTIVNLTALIEAIAAGHDAAFLLADPMAVVLWAVVGVTLFVWGRGTFCGWLCPFGALQELSSVIVRRLGWRHRVLPLRTDRLLKRVKYVVFGAIVVAAFVSPLATQRLVEIEPFKTSISLYFQREWPYVVWAVLCVAAGLFVYRGYCRYLCPLGAGLAVFGRVRLWAWIPRRAECGTPCQTCRHRCEYQAIAPTGRVDYAECFQCLDCVSIHDDPKRCLPLVRQRRPIPIRAVNA